MLKRDTPSNATLSRDSESAVIINAVQSYCTMPTKEKEQPPHRVTFQFASTTLVSFKDWDSS